METELKNCREKNYEELDLKDDFMFGKVMQDEELTQKLNGAVEEARLNEKWRLEYIKERLYYEEMRKEAYEEVYEEGERAGVGKGIKIGIRVYQAIQEGKKDDRQIAESVGCTIEEVETVRKQMEE